MLSPQKGGSGLKTNPASAGLQSLGALVIPHMRDCFWGIEKFESIPHMIPKSNARYCFLKENASFF